MSSDEGASQERKGGGSSLNDQMSETSKSSRTLASKIAVPLPIRITKLFDHKNLPAADSVSERPPAIKDQAERKDPRIDVDGCGEREDKASNKGWDPTFFQTNRSMASIGFGPLKSSLGKRRRGSQDEDELQHLEKSRKGVKATHSRVLH
jgi:hypothetical protein